MPSAFTHAAVGAALSALAPRPFRGVRLAATLAVAAALPDIDVLAFGLGIPYAHPLGHRGLTHSLVFALALAIVLWLALGRGTPLLSRSGGALLAVTFLACASHGFLDAFTDAGLGVGFFIPFDDRRWFFPWRPIRTSSLNPGDFFGAHGVAVLRNEMAWIWCPTAVLVAAAALVRSHLAAKR